MKTLTLEAEQLLMKLAIAHFIKREGGKVVIPFDIDAYTRGEELSIVDQNLLHDALRDVFCFERMGNAFTISRGNIVPRPKEDSNG